MSSGAPRNQPLTGSQRSINAFIARFPDAKQHPDRIRCCDYHSGRRSVAWNACSVSDQLGDSQSSCVRFLLSYQRVDHAAY
ncbi:hypothetical protein, partial [Acinetobacter pittii]|uniref:hypothetical protein n=1 Tax=Acinetobacter pittii TaxID=48296 RepID=UPI003AF093E7